MAKKRKKKTTSRKKSTKKKTTRKRTTKKKSTRRKTTKKVETALVENLISLQKVNTKLAEKFDHLSSEISKLLALFEVAAKDFAKNPEIRPLEKDSQFLDKVDTLLEQNKTIAKGLTLMEERIRERMHEHGEEPEENEDKEENYTLPRINIAPKMPSPSNQKEIKLPAPKLEPIQKTKPVMRTVSPPQTSETTTAPVNSPKADQNNPISNPQAPATTEIAANTPSLPTPSKEPLTPGLPELPKQTYPEDSAKTAEPKNSQELPALPKHGEEPEKAVDDNTMQPSQFNSKPMPKY